MRQERKPEAGKYKHNDAEHPIWIIDRRTSLICFVLQCGRKRYLTPQLLGFSFVLDRIVHLPVPSESFSRRGKKISEILRGLRGSQNAGVFHQNHLRRPLQRRLTRCPDRQFLLECE